MVGLGLRPRASSALLLLHLGWIPQASAECSVAVFGDEESKTSTSTLWWLLYLLLALFYFAPWCVLACTCWRSKWSEMWVTSATCCHDRVVTCSACRNQIVGCVTCSACHGVDTDEIAEIFITPYGKCFHLQAHCQHIAGREVQKRVACK
eukprot:6479720-Amphidinium_carterae.1